jgi:hypothetical protein
MINAININSYPQWPQRDQLNYTGLFSKQGNMAIWDYPFDLFFVQQDGIFLK